MPNSQQTFFAPQLYIPNGVTDISFYINAFGAAELRRFTNDDDTIHVVEFEINGAIFHLHEETKDTRMLSPAKANGTTVKVGLFVQDVNQVVSRAVKAGALLYKEAQDYDYGYRQAEIFDPFGHCWMIQQKL